ncbi:MAG: response regulator [Chloroflexi bacterium]|nr:response regulator [Chloroflexota bacterium]
MRKEAGSKQAKEQTDKQMSRELGRGSEKVKLQPKQGSKRHKHITGDSDDLHERFERILEAAPMPLAISRISDSAVLYANELLFQSLGIPSEARNGGIRLDNYCSPDDRNEVVDILRREGFVRDFEVRARKADGTEFWASASIQPMIFKGEQALLFGFSDVTKRKLAESKLQELYEQERNLRQQIESEMNRRVEFARMLAHELKTPLTPVLASSESLLAEIQDERLLSLARNISRGAQNLNRIIDELLDLARGEVGILDLNRETIDIIQVLRDAAESIAPLAMSKGLSLRLRLPPSLPLIQADAARVQQVVMNILNNAIKFTPRDGEVKIVASERNGFVMIEVQDTGLGMSRDEQARLFEPYQRTARDKGRLGGLGLGLALCKRLVELHGGQVWVKSRPRRGSTFGFSLPFDKVGGFPSDTKRREKLWKVLIIEDDREIVDSVSLALHKDWPEAEVMSTAMGEEGLDLVEAETPTIVILDLNLPDINGFDVLRQIRSFSSVPVVVLTVREAEEDVARALEWGADDYMTKPFRKKELLARLKAQLRKQHFSDDEMPMFYGPLCFDPATCQLRYGGRDLSLTIIEGRIIHCLLKHSGQVVTYSRLAEAVWGEDYGGATVTLRSHIRRLRRKLELDPSNPQLIMTKAGIGYSLVKPT